MLFLELLYGGFWEESHILAQENPLSSQHRFAFSFLFRPTSDNFRQLRTCLDTLEGVWPLKRPHLLFMKHFYYESDWLLSDFAPLLLLYSIVFLYITFSVGMYSLSPSALSLSLSITLSLFLSLCRQDRVSKVQTWFGVYSCYYCHIIINNVTWYLYLLWIEYNNKWKVEIK